MASKLLIAAAASTLFAVPAFAQEAAGAMSSSDTGAMAGDPAPKAATGAATDTSGVVGMADLRAGAAVRDAAGVSIGKIAKVKPAASGAAETVTLDLGANKWATVPASTLKLSDGVLVSSQTRAEILAGAEH
ncbi:hypothetical protein [Phenylobacterium sp.]|uniref:hypothetical protein n=1 Tax=Phenylobacterium sp. TaxID=1871053 RepID=UPI0035B1A290